MSDLQSVLNQILLKKIINGKPTDFSLALAAIWMSQIMNSLILNDYFGSY